MEEGWEGEEASLHITLSAWLTVKMTVAKWTAHMGLREEFTVLLHFVNIRVRGA